MEQVRFLKGDLNDLPSTLNKNAIYVAISSTSDTSSEICIDGKRWMSKEYVDVLISKMKTILRRLGATDDELNSITI